MEDWERKANREAIFNAILVFIVTFVVLTAINHYTVNQHGKLFPLDYIFG